MKLGGIEIDCAHPDGAIIAAGETSFAPSKLLLAGDNRIVCKVIIKILEPYNVRVTHVTRGDAALDALMTEKIAVALIDANHLPEMNGFDVTRHYRFAALGRKRIPILGLVSPCTAEQIGACIDAGMDGCLPKPIDPEHLLEAVRPYLNLEAGSVGEPSSDHGEDMRPHEVPAINMQILRDLEQLGGRGFVEDVVSQFVTDANRIFPDLADSIRNADVQASRDLLHALRSCAANVGASAIFELCLAWRAIDLEELVDRGEACLSRLQSEFENARVQMRDYETGNAGSHI